MVVFERLSSRHLRFKLKHFALTTFLFVFALAISPRAFADVIFEGYSKVLLEDIHIGYVVQRYEFDPKKKEFSTAYLLKTNAAGGSITESVKARSTFDLKPISYQYTELAGEKARTIDATFKGDTMTATVMTDGRRETISKKLPKGVFLASFLGYVMLQGKEGIKKDVKYAYQAIAEEDANIYSGEAFISGEETINGITAFKVLNSFKGAKFVSYVTHKGEVIATRSPVQNIATDLVATVNEATAGIPLNSTALSQLFGTIPTGTENVVARRASVDRDSAKALKLQGSGQTPDKKQGIAPGQGIIIKPAAKPDENKSESSSEPKSE